jgi:hypothetical protein
LTDNTLNWTELLKHPGRDHLVEVYQDPAFLAETVTHYLAAGLHLGEAAIVVASAENRERFSRALEEVHGLPAASVCMLDAEETLASFMVNGVPEWTAFQRVCGSAIANLCLRHPAVRAYGEMVDILWQRGERNAALRLEQFWNELGRQQAFSLLCAYRLDPLEPESYGGALESVCRCHTHLIPARDYSRLNRAVTDSAKKILDRPLAQMLLKLAAAHRPHTEMPLGQATLIWLKQNMPRTAERVLADVRAKLAV